MAHPDVDAVSFVGSTPVARHIYETGTHHGKRVQALGGAKNHMVVLPDADVDAAADAAISAGYGSAGERCMAISVVVAVGAVADPLVDAIAARIPDVVVGPGDDPASMMGPLITAEHRDRVRSYVDRRVRRGGPRGGRRLGRPHPATGSSSGARCSTTSSPACGCTTTRSSGRCWASSASATFDEALALVNANPYGNGVAAVHPGRRCGPALRARRRRSAWSASTCRSPCRSPSHSFGGWKASIFGDHPIYGPEGIRFYTRPKVVTSRWPDPASSVIDLGFPHGG